jgi:hypothetical protein
MKEEKEWREDESSGKFDRPAYNISKRQLHMAAAFPT